MTTRAKTEGKKEKVVKLTDLEIGWLLIKLGRHTEWDRALATKLREMLNEEEK